MTPLEKVIAYHERTKHHFQRFAVSLGHLDWGNQPDPFRRFVGAPLVRLNLDNSVDSGPSFDDLFHEACVAPAHVTFETISALLRYSLALSAWKQFRDSKWALRINPSSGNLHPTEGYLVLGPVDRLHHLPGVYHYAPKEHSLERRTEFSMEIWRQLTKGFPPGTFFVGLTSIHWREAWKYGERAYRYCQHDVGHAIAALSFSAATLGWQACMSGDRSDTDVASLLGVDRDVNFVDAEREHPDLFLAIVPNGADTVFTGRRTPPTDAITAVAAGRWSGCANRLSHDHVDWPIIDEVSIACEKGGISSTCGQLDSPAIHDAPPLPSSLAQGRVRGASFARRVILQRRSAVSMDGRTSISAGAFYLMLDRTLPRFDVTLWHALRPPVCVHLLLFIHRVDGVVPGLYFLVRAFEALDPLRAATDPDFAWTRPPGCPEHLPLYFLKKGDARRVAGQVSCGQEIAADGAFAVGMIAEFAPRLREFGPWFYRRLFWETGMIGQVLYLEAEAAGVRATGIGCFFDDPVHALLGLSNDDYQSLYHFTVGGATEDLRLMTWPPYERKSE